MSEKETRKRKATALLFIALVSIVAMVFLSSSSVMAATGFDIQDDKLTTDNGAVTGLEASVSGEITWDGAENPPKEMTVELQVKDPDGDDWETLETTKYENLNTLAGTRSYSFSSVDVTKSSWNNGDFNAAGDGTTADTEVTFRLRVETAGDLDGDGETPFVFTGPTDTSTVTVNNEAKSNTASGSGGTDAQGTNQEP